MIDPNNHFGAGLHAEIESLRFRLAESLKEVEELKRLLSIAETSCDSADDLTESGATAVL